MAFCLKDMPCGHSCERQDDHGGACDCFKICPDSAHGEQWPTAISTYLDKTKRMAEIRRLIETHEGAIEDHKAELKALSLELAPPLDIYGDW